MNEEPKEVVVTEIPKKIILHLWGSDAAWVVSDRVEEEPKETVMEDKP
jgi:hypothetical protein